MSHVRPVPRPARALAAALLGLALLALLRPTPAQADRLADVRQRGYLLAGVKDAVPPFGFRDPATGTLEGFEPDLVRAVAKRLGVTARLEPVSVSTRIAALADGRLDLVAATMTHTFSRDEVIDFSVTYFMDGVRLLTAVESGIKDTADLAGRTVAAMVGDTAGEAVSATQPRCRVTPMEGYAQAFLALKQGQAAALAADASVLLFLKNADPEPERWEIVGPALSCQPVAMGLPENESGLRDAVNRALADLWLGGQYRRIHETWFGVGAPYRLPLDWDMEIWPR